MCQGQGQGSHCYFAATTQSIILGSFPILHNPNPAFALSVSVSVSLCLCLCFSLSLRNHNSSKQPIVFWFLKITQNTPLSFNTQNSQTGRHISYLNWALSLSGSSIHFRVLRSTRNRRQEIISLALRQATARTFVNETKLTSEIFARGYICATCAQQ